MLRAGHDDDGAGPARAASGCWQVGVPPSGPMDAVSLRLGEPRRRQPGRRARARDHARRADAAVLGRDPSSASRGAPAEVTVDGEAVADVGTASTCRRAACSRRRGRPAPGLRPTCSRAQAGSTCRGTSAAPRPSRSAGSAATAAARSRRATCCGPARRLRRLPEPLRRRGAADPHRPPTPAERRPPSPARGSSA